MLLKTYDRILNLFHENHGYMSFRQMKDLGVTELQIQELKNRGVLECYARGHYWCPLAGYQKPEDYKYVEVGHAFPNAALCMDTAAWLHGLISTEPEVISIATTRENRQKVSIYFPVHRYYFQNTGDPKEFTVVKTKFGSYRIYDKDRTICDCIRMERELPEGMTEKMIRAYAPSRKQIENIIVYGKQLRAYRPVKAKFEEMGMLPKA